MRPRTLTHKHTRCYCSRNLWQESEISSVVCRAEEEVAPARSHMMQKTGSDTDKCRVTNASVVNSGLVLRVCPVCAFLIFSVI